jgi:cell division protein ZapA
VINHTSSGSDDTPSTVVVKILDKEYQISCPPSEQDALLKSARYLDENMRKIKGRGNIHGLEKVSVMAALNIAHEMLGKNRLLNETRHNTVQQIKFLEDKIERALRANVQMEL